MANQLPQNSADESAETPASGPDNRRPSASVRWGVLVVCGLLVFVSRFHTRNEPLQVDTAAYAVIAHEMLLGRALYRDIWDHKPPATHVTYLLSERLFGYGESQLLALNLLFAFVSLLLIERWTRLIAGHVPALLAAVLFALTSGDTFLQGNEANCELMINTFSLAAVLCLASADRRRLRWPLLCGLFLAVASLYKTTAVFLGIALVPALLWRGGAPGFNRRGLAQVALMALPGALVWGGLIFYYHLQGRFADFHYAVFTYNSRYAGALLLNIGRGFHPDNLVFHRGLTGLLPLLPFSAVWLLVVLRRDRSYQHRLVGLYAVGAFLQIATPGHFFAHYYRLLLPFVCVTSGIVWVELLRARLLKSARPVRRIWLAAPLVCAVFYAWYLTLSPAKISTMKYGDVYVNARRLAGRLSQDVAQDEVIYQFGRLPGIYFYTGRRAPGRFVYAFPLYAKTEQAKRQREEVLALLASAEPKLIVTEPFFLDNPPAPGFAETLTTAWPTRTAWRELVILSREAAESDIAEEVRNDSTD